MKRCIILSGVSGSGKSVRIDSLFDEDAEKREWVPEGTASYVASADDYFLRVPAGKVHLESLTYNFDSSKLQEAHADCFRRFIEACQRSSEGSGYLLFVDNTNTTTEEIAPYVLGAMAYGFDVEILTLMCRDEDDLRLCADRNRHGVSYAAIERQHLRLLNRKLTPFWPPSRVEDIWREVDSDPNDNEEPWGESHSAF